jgi:Ca2+/Na+ antiporter
VFFTVLGIATVLMFFDYWWLRLVLFVVGLGVAWFMSPRKYYMILMATSIAFWNFITLFFRENKLLVGDFQVPGVGVFVIILLVMYSVYYVVKVLMTTRKSNKTDTSHIT